MIRPTSPPTVVAMSLVLIGLTVWKMPALGAGKAQPRQSPGPTSLARAASAQLPDWSGQWEIEGMTPSATGGLQQSLSEVLTDMRGWGPPPYRADIRSKVERAVAFFERGRKEQMKNGPSGVTGPSCTWGYPLVMLASPLMFEVLPTPKETVLVFSGREVRHVYTDGRAHTAKEDLWPTYWGDSIGHWEDQTLVIDTIDVESPQVPPRTPAIPIFAFGGDAPEFAFFAILSLQAHFIERIRMIGDRLEDRMTIIDPIMFSTPWRVRRIYRRVPHVHRMIYEDCGGEDRNPVVNGRYTLAPPPFAPSPPPDLAPLLQVLLSGSQR